MQEYITDAHDALLSQYEEARKRHRQVLERFFWYATMQHGQQIWQPSRKPNAEELAELARLEAEEHAAYEAWLASFARR